MSTVQQEHQRAIAAVNRRDYATAHQHCLNILKQQPQHADSYFLLGIMHSETGQFSKATELIKRAISFKADIEYYAYLAKCYALLGDSAAVLATVQHTPFEKISVPLTLDTIGVALSLIGVHEQALAYFKKALDSNKPVPSFYYNYAVSCKFSGDFEQARWGFQQAIKLHPQYHQAHFALAELGTVDTDAEHEAQLKSLLPEASPGTDGKLHLSHALAKILERKKQYSDAFTVLREAKSEKRQQMQYSFDEDLQLFDFIALQQKKLAKKQKTGCSSKRPIFVLGMPRSGTTLVERILTCHTDVSSGGELQDFGVAVKELAATPSRRMLDQETLAAAERIDFKKLGERYIQLTANIGADAPHFVDKLPFNFFYIHLIRQALPEAKIICLLRNPMDTCIGNYRQLFSISNPYYRYAYDLQSTGLFYEQFWYLAHRWQQLDSDNFLLLNYEQLVSDPENQIKQLIAFCDLDWQQQCLYAEKNQAPVSTASKVQVREPINTRSIGQWQRYKPHTDELESYLRQKGFEIITGL